MTFPLGKHGRVIRGEPPTSFGKRPDLHRVLGAEPGERLDAGISVAGG